MSTRDARVVQHLFPVPLLIFSSALRLPTGTQPDARFLLTARAVRAFGDGYISLLLPFYLTLLGFSAFEVGLLITATLAGSGVMTLAAGLLGHRFAGRSLLLAATLLMIFTGIAVVLISDFWPLMLIALVGTLNPSHGDISVFLPLEQSMLTETTTPQSRTALFARYSLIGALVGALGAQAAGLPTWGEEYLALDGKHVMQAMFLCYAALGIINFLVYRRLKRAGAAHSERVERRPLGESKKTVYKLAGLFSLDAFAGGFAVQSLIALWLLDRFGLSLAGAATIFFWVGILTAFSYLVAVRIANRIGLVNTMVFTHLPANVFLLLVPFMPTLSWALFFLFLRSALSSMDVPVRSSYVMAVVTPGERAAAASLTAVPRALAASVSPSIAGYLLTLSAFGWPLVVCGGLKIVYDLLLLKMFNQVKPPEEQSQSRGG